MVIEKQMKLSSAGYIFNKTSFMPDKSSGA
jgi:hypothetical protein